MDIKLETKKGIKTKHIGLLLLIAILIFSIWKIGFATNLNTFRTEKEKLFTAKIIEGKFDDYITISGNVAPIRTIYMDAYEGGRVAEKLIEEGSMVKKGAIILKLENKNLYAKILGNENNLALKQNNLRTTKLSFDEQEARANRDLINAEYNLKRQKRNYLQNKELFNEALIAKETYLRAKDDYEQANKQLEILQLQTQKNKLLHNTSLKELDVDLARMQKTLSVIYESIDHLNVRAPADGQLGFLDAEIGQNISSGKRIGQINVLTNFKIEAEIDEHYIDRVKRELHATIERNDEIFNLKLRKVYPEVRNGRFKVDLTFTGNKPTTIRSGQTYTIKLQLGASSKALLIPKGSFFQSTGGQSVFVINPSNNTAFKRAIKLGKQNSKYYEVLEGLQKGEQVIISNYDNFGEAEKIILK